MDDATWLPVPGFRGDYEISDDGRLRSRKAPGAPPRLLRPAPNPLGYLVGYLSLDGVMHRMTVHRLVMLAFVGPRPDGMDIRHLDGNHRNNSLENLAYGTRTENNRDILRHGTNYNKGKTHCIRGHVFDESNTIPTPDGKGRACRECARRRVREYRARKRGGGGLDVPDDRGEGCA